MVITTALINTSFLLCLGRKQNFTILLTEPHSLWTLKTAFRRKLAQANPILAEYTFNGLPYYDSPMPGKCRQKKYRAVFWKKSRFFTKIFKKSNFDNTIFSNIFFFKDNFQRLFYNIYFDYWWFGDHSDHFSECSIFAHLMDKSCVLLLPWQQQHVTALWATLDPSYGCQTSPPGMWFGSMSPITNY